MGKLVLGRYVEVNEAQPSLEGEVQTPAVVAAQPPLKVMEREKILQLMMFGLELGMKPLLVASEQVSLVLSV
jgi:hypothetical protein